MHKLRRSHVFQITKPMNHFDRARSRYGKQSSTFDKNKMMTYKQRLYKRWWRGNFIAGIGVFILILFLVFSSKVEYTLLIIPIILVSSLVGGLKCPSCKKRLIIPSGCRGFNTVNYCAACGFDLNQNAQHANPQKKTEQ